MLGVLRKVLKHPQMTRRKGTYINDLGLLYIDFPATGASFARPICRSHLELPFRPLEDPLLLGWGVPEDGSFSEVLKHVPIR